MKFLLDTCVISEFVKPTPNKNVLYWLNNTSSDDLFLCSLTIGELRKGITRLPNSKRKKQLDKWLNSLLKEYKDRIFSIDIIVSENWGIIQGNAEKNGTPMSSIDGLISATAYTHNLTIITRNEKDFIPSQVPIINPWESKRR